uniref:Uncharacterized protein LOC111100476 isoform X3 n=1 Tax=Crassostrea virginica TaxID=6565 RepID=A0A8B8AC96_CRAVI|nr:uncharacterized protein LOC111100476 isoform X3 [Crassostrea virginica]
MPLYLDLSQLNGQSMASQSDHYEEGPSTSKRSKLEREDGHPDTKETNRKLGWEVDERIFTYVSDLVPFSTAKFGILQLGPYCNATESCSFTEANCHVKTVINENDLALILEFNQLFSKGVQLLSDLKGNVRELEEHELAAMRILDDFFKEKDQHEQSLNKILRGHQSDVERKVNSDTDTTIALAEHLLGKLSPGKSYIIDSRVKRKGKCRCGFNHCKSDPVFGSTGIGHEEVWHGFIDIIFSSHAGIPETAASVVDSEDNVGSETLTCSFDEREDERAGDSPGGGTIAEEKNSLSVLIPR